jgi:hypothetical protein
MRDGSDSFHSTTVPCPGCVPRTDANGEGHFRHTGVSAPLGKAGSPRVLPCAVEEGRTSDGQDKQDGAVPAAQRLLPRLRQAHPQRPLRVGGDALYCHAPCMAQWRKLRLPHVLVCQPTSHGALCAWGEDMERWDGGGKGQWHEGPACRRRFFPSRSAPSVPLTAARRLWGTWVEVWEHDRAGQQLDPTAWCTDLEVPPATGPAIVRSGRSRWKIANEPCNGHNNHGDELEHNSGHGPQTLSRGCYLLTLLAFIAPGLLERGESLYPRGVATTSRRELWHTWRTAMRMMVVPAWADCLLSYLDEGGPSP